MKILATISAFFIFSCSTAQSNLSLSPRTNSGSKPATFTYQLTIQCTTSAGIYTNDNVLVRTLWAQETQNASRHTYTWDGNNDTGMALPAGSYTWKVLTNNVKYQWQGVIGNTSDSMSGTTKHKGYTPIVTMCFSGQYAYYGVAYNEALTMTYKVDTNHIGKHIPILPIPYGFSPSIIRNCTDGNYVYWAAVDAYKPNNSFVYATKVSDDLRITFAHGYSYAVTNAGNQSSYSTIGFENDVTGNISDIAVQKTGNKLFIARNNEVIVLNKLTGALIDSIHLSGVAYLRIDASDSYLWINYKGDSTTRFTINNDGTITSTGLTVISSQPVVAMDINSQTLAICEGGTNQIIKFYNPVTGIYISSFGHVRGYLTNANVSNNKFYWNDARGTYASFYCFYSQWFSFWVGDYGNGRAQHYDSNDNYINRIGWIPTFYNVGVDYSNPSRRICRYEGISV